jgi:hypothetical protein
MASAEAIAYALLASVAGGRVYPLVRPQEGVLPAVVTSLISLRSDDRLTQTVGPNLYRARLQADCIASTYTDLKALVDAVRTAVHLKSGLYAGKTVVASQLDNVGPDGVDLDSNHYFQAVDFLITFYD